MAFRGLQRLSNPHIMSVLSKSTASTELTLVNGTRLLGLEKMNGSIINVDLTTVDHIYEQKDSGMIVFVDKQSQVESQVQVLDATTRQFVIRDLWSAMYTHMGAYENGLPLL